MYRANLNGAEIFAVWVAERLDKEPEVIDKAFKCMECEADAYFNKGSKRQSPHFASKKHTDGCGEARKGNDGRDPKLVKANTLIIEVGASDVGPSGGSAHTKSGQSVQRTVMSGAADATHTAVRRGVGAVLRQLLIDPEFALAPLDVVVGKAVVPANEFFVPFFELEEQHAGRTVGVWGDLYSAREGSYKAWLNRGDGKVTIQIPTAIFNELKASYKFKSAAQLQDAKFLLIGRFNMNLEYEVTDAKQIALHVVAG